MRGPTNNAAIPSLTFKSGHNGSKIGPYSQLGLEEDDQLMAVAPVGGAINVLGELSLRGQFAGRDPVNRQRQTARGAGIRACGHTSAPVGPT